MVEAYKANFKIIRNGERIDEELIFSDSEGIEGNVLGEDFIYDVLDKIKDHTNYKIDESLVSVTQLEDYVQPFQIQFALISAEEPFIIIGEGKNGLNFAFLCRMTHVTSRGSRGLFVVGVWPNELAEEFKQDQGTYNALVESLGKEPDKWNQVITITYPGLFPLYT
jgi:hypothetical protein